ncbi:MBL fold metallo-hydrolase [Sphingorhabdus sp. IMCC26285]|uniref:MBL fold metallo-hydrolase n=1 Tax=Sphingorhabdus profundilacus TaxID=2509718 RepID=A0A6I4LWW1_9SPHN|nr:MBL fold metallo-hydrolase [Sphingorhabdus profundilacus]MVZ97501.1 MBL fold metallo-hydrolase [Sphingorhabdus profundilacus]
MKMLSSLFALAFVSVAGPAMAQDDLSKVEIKPVILAPGVAVLFGAGGNIGVSYGEDGTVLIDDQFAPLTGKIQAAVAALGAQPVKFLVNTHWHFDHSGGNENLGKAGVTIMAHDNVRVRMAAGATVAGNVVPPAAKAALPVITYADGLKLHLNGEEVRVIHMPAGHTDGDSIIHWTKSNVIHMGDLFMLQISFPFVDVGSGGDVRGFVTAADKVLDIANDQTKIIPGHGAIATKADLQNHRNMIATVIAKVEAGIKEGKTLDQIKASRPADGFGVKTDGFITAERFIETVYAQLKG